MPTVPAFLILVTRVHQMAGSGKLIPGQEKLEQLPCTTIIRTIALDWLPCTKGSTAKKQRTCQQIKSNRQRQDLSTELTVRHAAYFIKIILIVSTIRSCAFSNRKVGYRCIPMVARNMAKNMSRIGWTTAIRACAPPWLLRPETLPTPDDCDGARAKRGCPSGRLSTAPAKYQARGTSAHPAWRRPCHHRSKAWGRGKKARNATHLGAADHQASNKAAELVGHAHDIRE